MSSKISGIIIPAITPFDEVGEIDYTRMEKNYNKWCSTNICGVMALGSNGEFRSLSDDEAFAVISKASGLVPADKIFIAGVGRESLYQTKAFIKRLQNADLRIDYVSVLTPSYFAGLMTDKALYEYYTELADFSKWPLLLYCAPKFTNKVCISADLLSKLADHPNIAGIKDTSSDMMEEYMQACGSRDDFQVISGSLGNIMTCLGMGGHAGVVSGANYFPSECAKLIEVFDKKGFEATREYHKKLQFLTKSTGAISGVASVKCAMNLNGLYGGFPRKPILPVSPETFETIADNMRKYANNTLFD